MSLDRDDPNRIYEQDAIETRTKKKQHIRMMGMHLCGFGVFSNVYKGTLVSPHGNKAIAIKKTFPESKKNNEPTFETKFLSLEGRRPHKNIIHMLYYFSNSLPGGSVCDAFVFDYMPETLDSVIHNHILTPLDIKLYTWQIFNGLHYCSRLDVVHRDLKPVNILVDHASGILKISDFGSAKIIKNNEPGTSYQVTRYYRPPELLLGAKHYSWRVDVWSGGCCFAEMLKKNVLLRGRDSKHQLLLIVRVLGPPSESDQHAMKVHARFEGEHLTTGFARLLPNTSSDSIHLLSRIMVYKPKERLCGLRFLKDPYFHELFVSGTRRQNGRFLADAVDKTDLTFAEMDELGRQEKQDRKQEKSAEPRKKTSGLPIIKMPSNSPSDDVADARIPKAPRGTVMPRSMMSRGAMLRKTPESSSAMGQLHPRTRRSNARK